MEEGLFTLWSIAHLLFGIILAFILSNKWTKIIEYAGIIALFPLFFIENLFLKIISLVVILMAVLALIIEYLSIKGKKLRKYQGIVLALVLILGWEIFEYSTSSVTGFGIESLINRISDIIIGFISFFLVYTFLNKKSRNYNNA